MQRHRDKVPRGQRGAPQPHARMKIGLTKRGQRFASRRFTANMVLVVGAEKDLVMWHAIYTFSDILLPLLMLHTFQLRPYAALGTKLLRLNRIAKTHFQESLDKVTWQPSLGIFFCSEVLEHVRHLFPVVEGFLASISPCSTSVCLATLQKICHARPFHFQMPADKVIRVLHT